MRQETMGFWDAVASAGPYANNLHKGTKNRVSTNPISRMDGARFEVPLDTKDITSETFFPASLLARYWKKSKSNKTNKTNSKWSILTQKHTKMHNKPFRKKHTKTNLTLTRYKLKNCSYLCAYRCAQLSYTTYHGTVLIIFRLYLQTTTIAQMLSIGGEREPISTRYPGYFFNWARLLSPEIATILSIRGPLTFSFLADNYLLKKSSM